MVLLWYGAPIPFTASIELARLVPNSAEQAAILVTVAGLALAATQWMPHRLKALRLLCLLPQQIVLWLSALSIVAAIVAAQYGDGVLRPRPFIFLDQLPVLLLCLFYTAAVLEPAARIFWREKLDGSRADG